MKRLFFSEIVSAVMALIVLQICMQIGYSAQESLITLVGCGIAVFLALGVFGSWTTGLGIFAGSAVAIATIAIVAFHRDDVIATYAAVFAVLLAWDRLKVCLDSTVPYFITLFIEALGVWAALDGAWLPATVCGVFILTLTTFAWKWPAAFSIVEPAEGDIVSSPQ